MVVAKRLFAFLLLSCILASTFVSCIAEEDHDDHEDLWELAVAVPIESPEFLSWTVTSEEGHAHEEEGEEEGGHLRALMYLSPGECTEDSIHDVEEAAHELWEDNTTAFEEVEFGDTLVVFVPVNGTVSPYELHSELPSYLSIYFLNITEPGCLVMFLEHEMPDFLRKADGHVLEPAFTEPGPPVIGSYSAEIWATALAATLLTSLVSVVGSLIFVVLLIPGKDIVTEYSTEALALSAGVLLAVGYLHLLPEANEIYGELDVTFAIVILAAMIVALVLKLMLDHLGPVPVANSKTLLEDEESSSRELLIHHSSALNVVWGDAFHNFTDGILIATAFGVCSADSSLGWFVTSTVVLHELPQEIADFAIIYTDLGSICAALMFNLLSSLSALLGAVIVLAIGQVDDKSQGLLFAVNIGILAFISLGEIVPRLADEASAKRKILRIFLVVLGFVIIGLLQLSEHGHCEAGDGHEHDHGHE